LRIPATIIKITGVFVGEIENILWEQVNGLSLLRLKLLRALVERRPRYVTYFDLKIAMYGSAHFVNTQQVALQKHLLSLWMNKVADQGVDLGTTKNFPNVGYAMVSGDDSHVEVLRGILKEIMDP
jgi:hypothetical protein